MSENHQRKPEDVNSNLSSNRVLVITANQSITKILEINHK